MLNDFLPTVSVLCYFLPIAYIHVLYIFQKSSSQHVLGLPIGLLDMGFHLLILCTILSSAQYYPLHNIILCTILSSAMRSIWPNQFSLCFLINPIIFCPFVDFLISFNPPVAILCSCRTICTACYCTEYSRQLKHNGKYYNIIPRIVIL